MKFVTFRKPIAEGSTAYWTRFVIFPEEMIHSDIANVMKLSKSLQGFKVFSAGFVNLHLGNFICHGQSESMMIKPTKEDHDINSRIMLMGKYGPMEIES